MWSSFTQITSPPTFLFIVLEFAKENYAHLSLRNEIQWSTQLDLSYSNLLVSFVLGHNKRHRNQECSQLFQFEIEPGLLTNVVEGSTT